MENKPSKKLMLECGFRARMLQVRRNIPIGQKKKHVDHYGDSPVLAVNDGRRLIIEAVQKGSPYMVARFGTSEGRALNEYWTRKLWSVKRDYSDGVKKELCVNAGFFPCESEMIDKWAEMETEACADLDLLGTMDFVGEEWIYRTFCHGASLMRASGISSAAKGWTWCLEGKKVLVIHPFADTIISQYTNHREEIFPGSNSLPLFDLKCIKAVQTIADATDDRFETWFDALDYMTEEVGKQDFDVALLGCGAYGFQLASRIKRMGKTAVHMGGSLQTLFGIKGSRWDKQYSSMYNYAWVYPSEEETPAGAEKVEGGCYWK